MEGCCQIGGWLERRRQYRGSSVERHPDGSPIDQETCAANFRLA
jgi:hypothetical protein